MNLRVEILSSIRNITNRLGNIGFNINVIIKSRSNVKLCHYQMYKKPTMPKKSIYDSLIDIQKKIDFK